MIGQENIVGSDRILKQTAASTSVGPIMHFVLPNQVRRRISEQNGEIVFLVSMPSQELEIGLVRDSIPAAAFAGNIAALHFQIGVAARAVQALRRKNKFLETFIALLQGAISRREFNREATKLAIRFRELEESQLQIECNIAWQLTSEKNLDSTELSEMLDVSLEKIETLLSKREKIKGSVEARGKTEFGGKSAEVSSRVH
jgi:hypothetical protein